MSWVSEQAGLGGRGDGDAVPCHERSAPCFVFEGHTAAVTASAVLCSQPDPKALPAALASALFVPAFPLLQDFCLSPLASRASQHLGTSEVARPRWLLALGGRVGAGLGSTARKAQDAACMPAVELNCRGFRGLGSPSQQAQELQPRCSVAEQSSAAADIPKGSNPGEAARSSSHRAGLVPKQTAACKQILT